MSVSIRNKKDVMALTFSGEMTIYTAKEYHTKISKKFTTKKNVDVDLSAVEEIDSSGLQLLASISAELKNVKTKKKHEMNIVAASDVVNDALEMSRLFSDEDGDDKES